MKNCWQLARNITLLLTALHLLGGCGQMGPLYHPETPASQLTTSR
ncbi:MAG: lipoprotein [Immundisolibacteraceae bacterium]|nr:lipoprotein [Immundisolibacteraceae bacterium]